MFSSPPASTALFFKSFHLSIFLRCSNFSLPSSPHLSHLSSFILLLPPFSSFCYLSHLPITLPALTSSSPSQSPPRSLYRRPSHIMQAWLTVRRGAYWIVIRVCLLSCGFECWTWSYAGSEGSGRVCVVGGETEGDSAAGSGRWMGGIRGLTDKANGNKWLPCQLTNERTGPGIEPIKADKHWHDTQLVCSPQTWPTFFCSSCYPNSVELKKNSTDFYELCIRLWLGSWSFTRTSRMHRPEFVRACTCLCNVHSSIAVMDGVPCCSSGAISQPESRGWPPGYDAPH